jgi:hypothetical protein
MMLTLTLATARRFILGKQGLGLEDEALGNVSLHTCDIYSSGH